MDETGAFLSSVDLYFANVDPSTKCTIEIRDVQLGTPTDTMIADHARVILEPSQINVSTDASIPTRVTFPSPLYLEPEREYAIVALAPGMRILFNTVGLDMTTFNLRGKVLIGSDLNSDEALSSTCLGL